MKEKDNKVIIWIIIIWIAFSLALILLWYKVECIKGSFDLWSIIIGNTVVISIFVITYFLIDRRNIRIYENKWRVASAVLVDTYDKCAETIKMLEDKNVRSHVASKVNGNIPIGEEKTLLQLHDYPFYNDGLLAQFAADGILSAKQYSDYLKVKSTHWRYVYQAVAFYDYYDDFDGVQCSLVELKSSLEEAKANLGY